MKMFNSKANSVSTSDGYFVVGRTKFIVMWIFTFGIYSNYWAYKNWKYIKTREQSNIMPFWRAFFLFPMWIFSLANKIHDHCIEVSENPNFNHISVARSYLVFIPLSFFLRGIFGIIFGLLAVDRLFVLQNAALRIHQKLEIRVDKNSDFNTWNYLVMFLGAFIHAILIAAIVVRW